MRIDYTPALRDEELTILEEELLRLADALGAGDVDISSAANRAMSGFDVFYGDGRPDDAALAEAASRLVAEWNGRQPMKRIRTITLSL